MVKQIRNESMLRYTSRIPVEKVWRYTAVSALTSGVMLGATAALYVGSAHEAVYVVSHVNHGDICNCPQESSNLTYNLWSVNNKQYFIRWIMLKIHIVHFVPFLHGEITEIIEILAEEGQGLH